MADQKYERTDAMCLWFSPHPSVFLASQKTEQVVFIQHVNGNQNSVAPEASKIVKKPPRARRRHNRDQT